MSAPIGFQTYQFDEDLIPRGVRKRRMIRSQAGRIARQWAALWEFRTQCYVIDNATYREEPLNLRRST